MLSIYKKEKKEGKREKSLIKKQVDVDYGGGGGRGCDCQSVYGFWIFVLTDFFVFKVHGAPAELLKGDRAGAARARAVRSWPSRMGLVQNAQSSAAKLLSRTWQASLWTVDGWPLAHPILHVWGIGRHANRLLWALTRGWAVSSVGNEASGRFSLATRALAAAEDAAGTMVGAEGRAGGGEALAECGHGSLAVARRRIPASKDAWSAANQDLWLKTPCSSERKGGHLRLAFAAGADARLWG